MNPITRHCSRLVALLAAVLSIALSPVGAQDSDKTSPGLAAAEVKQVARLNSRALFEADDMEGAERALEAASRRDRKHPAFDFEIAAALTQVAADFSSRNDSKKAAAIARRALARLAVAKPKLDAAAAPAQQANLMELAGSISERFLGDTQAARAYYAAAVALAPELGHAAESLTRLVEAEAELARKNAR